MRVFTGCGGNALTLTDNLGQRWTRGSRPGPAWCRTDSFASCHEVCDEAGTGVQGDDRNPSGDRRTADAGELGRGPPRGDSALCVAGGRARGGGAGPSGDGPGAGGRGACGGGQDETAGGRGN